ncbi:MAG: TraR/DksA C4-type zinc finger protein [Ignavibacteria bacterium]|nr:TraR/DksA C4-type zinc finger protein [Ignavibacteria bacterium]
MSNTITENTDLDAIPTVRYSDEDLETFRNVIEKAKTEAHDEMRMLRERLDDLTNQDNAEDSMIYSMHMAEQGSEAIEKEKTYTQMNRINEYLRKLDESLERIKEKTYGVCKECGILIAKERLMAVPITTLSASFKIRQQCPEDGIDRITKQS